MDTGAAPTYWHTSFRAAASVRPAPVRATGVWGPDSAGEYRLSPRATPAPAVFGGPAHAEPSVTAHPPDHFPVDAAVPLGQHGRPFAGRDEPGEIVPEFVTQR